MCFCCWFNQFPTSGSTVLLPIPCWGTVVLKTKCWGSYLSHFNAAAACSAHVKSSGVTNKPLTCVLYVTYAKYPQWLSDKCSGLKRCCFSPNVFRGWENPTLTEKIKSTVFSHFPTSNTIWAFEQEKSL